MQQHTSASLLSMRPLAGSGALSTSFEAPLALRRRRTPPVIERASGAAITEMDSLAIRRASVILKGRRSS